MTGIFNRGNNQDPEKFWREYGERYGETVLVFGLCRYISGWAEFQDNLWGLAIATSGGFRFHHFPHESWIQAISRTGFGGDAPTEKTLFIPYERILGTELRIEKSWWKRLLNPSLPHLTIRYRLEGPESDEDTLVIEADQKAGELRDTLGACRT
jgi:hypothetical protein